MSVINKNYDIKVDTILRNAGDQQEPWKIIFLSWQSHLTRKAIETDAHQFSKVCVFDSVLYIWQKGTQMCWNNRKSFSIRHLGEGRGCKHVRVETELVESVLQWTLLQPSAFLKHARPFRKSFHRPEWCQLTDSLQMSKKEKWRQVVNFRTSQDIIAYPSLIECEF